MANSKGSDYYGGRRTKCKYCGAEVIPALHFDFGGYCPRRPTTARLRFSSPDDPSFYQHASYRLRKQIRKEKHDREANRFVQREVGDR